MMGTNKTETESLAACRAARDATRAAWLKAREAQHYARIAYRKAQGPDVPIARAACERAEAACARAWRPYEDAVNAVDAEMAAIEAASEAFA